MAAILTQIGFNQSFHSEPLTLKGFIEDEPKAVFCSKNVKEAALPAITQAVSSHEHELSARYVKKKTFKILSLDGGGVRAGFTIQMLARLEKEVGMPLGLVFDSGAGTSAGAILLTLLMTPHPEDKTKPLYSAQWLQENFTELAQKIFPPPNSNAWLPVKLWDKLKTVGRVEYPEYDKKGISDIADLYLKDTLAKDALKPILVPSYQMCKKMKTRFITRENCSHGFFNNLLMKKLLLMTSAAPTFFAPEPYNGYAFWDGGIFANNPMLAAYESAPNGSKLCCSFGTGITPTALDEEHFNPATKDWGLLKVAPNLIDFFLNSQEIAVDTEMRKIFSLKNKNKPEENEGYYRWQKQIPNISLDDSRTSTLELLQKEGKELPDEYPDEWRSMVMQLSKAENDEPYAQPGIL